MKYIIEVKPGVWFAPWSIPIGTTTDREFAKEFQTEKAAESMLADMRHYLRGFESVPNARIMPTEEPEPQDDLESLLITTMAENAELRAKLAEVHKRLDGLMVKLLSVGTQEKFETPESQD